MIDALVLDDDIERAVVEPEKCIGCGVCMACPQDALKRHRFERTKPFRNRIELGITMAKDNNRA